MAKFTKVKGPEIKRVAMSQFFGTDLRNAPSNVSKGRSPSCPNMIRDTVGSNRKRYGYETLFQIDAPFNGGHVLKGSPDKVIVHGDTKIYSVDMDTFATSVLYSTANNAISVSAQINGKLYIADGANFLVYDGTTVAKVSASAYIPTIIIGRLYNGGGTVLEPVNLIQPKRTERFTGDDTHTTFQLSATNIDAAAVTIQSLLSDGTFGNLVEGTDFTVNHAAGTFTVNAVKPAPVTGVDNLYVTYAKTIEGYSDRIEKCDIFKLYGISGQRDILITAGNPDLVNYDWYSRANDPTYFGDTWYSVLGQDSSKIIGYSIINDRLVTHKDAEDNDATIVRTFEYINNAITFKTQGSFQATGALAKWSFASFDNEPLYVTVQKDISAITPSDVLGERFSQERSYFISPALAKEPNLKDSYGIVYDDFYMLAVGDRIYIMDSIQPIYEKDTPYSNRQYECYYWTGIGARVLWVYNGRLFFGAGDGKVKRFFNETDASWTDDGEPFECWFDTFEIYGSTPEVKKTFNHIAILLAAHVRTGCRVWFKVDGIWEIFFDYDETANFIDFNDIDFNAFTFRTDDTPTVIGGKMKLKNVLHTQIRLENSRNEPFGIYFATLKYTESGEFIK